MAHPAEVVVALCFHDAVYDARAADNEERSAHLARSALAGLLPDDAVARISAHVLATKHHRPHDADSAAVVDADLSILGAAPRAYDRFETAVREEYAFVDDATWRLGRGAVLSDFLARPRLFATDAFHDALEARARANLARARRSLSV